MDEMGKGLEIRQDGYTCTDSFPQVVHCSTILEKVSYTVHVYHIYLEIHVISGVEFTVYSVLLLYVDSKYCTFTPSLLATIATTFYSDQLDQLNALLHNM